MLISGVEFSRLANTSKQNICKLARNKKLVKTIDDKYDTYEPINKEYLLSRGLKITDIDNFVISMSDPKQKINPIQEQKSAQIPVEVKTHRVKQKEIILTVDDNNEISDDIYKSISGLPEKTMNMTLVQLLATHGNLPGLKVYIESLNKLTQAAKNQQELHIKRMELIPKDFISGIVFGLHDSLHKKILDYPISIADKIISMVQVGSGTLRQDIIELIKNGISKSIEDSQQIIAGEIKKLKQSRHEKNETE